MQRSAILVGVLVFAFACLGSRPAAAELAAWDQARVTDIAKQLATATQAWELSVREQPGLDQVGTGDAQEGFGLREKAQVLREMAEGLAGRLEKGDGYDKTHNMYRSMKEIVDDTDVIAQRSELDEPTMDAWAKVADLLRQIAPYYDPKSNTETGK